MSVRRSVFQPRLVTIAVLFLATGLAGCAKGATTGQPISTNTSTPAGVSPETAAPDSGSTSAPSAAPSSDLDLSKDYGDGITLATTCNDFLQQHDASARYDAAIRMSSDFKVDDPGNPMWGINMDSVCGSNPGITLGEYFGRAGRR